MTQKWLSCEHREDIEQRQSDEEEKAPSATAFVMASAAIDTQQCLPLIDRNSVRSQDRQQSWASQ